MTLYTQIAGRTRAIRTMAALLALSGTAALADVPGAIKTTEGRVFKGQIRWMGVSKQYSVITDKGVTMKISATKVADSRVKKPKNLEGAIRLVAAGQPDRAIPVLEQIAKDYTMLQWDLPATRWLVKAYIDKKESRKALDAAERLIRNRPEAGHASEIAPFYWQALLAENKLGRLNQMIDKAVSSGSHAVQAMALNMRGAAKKKERDFENALIDGYLRVVTLYSAVKDAQPEALYHAAECMQEMGRVTDAEKMRKELLTKYGRSQYAQKLKGGA